MEDAKYFFKYKDYDLAKAYFEDGNTIYCDDLGPYGGKRGEVISFNVEDVELDEDDAEENNYTAEDLNEPVVFDRYVSQLSTNTIEWDSTIGDLWCWEEDLDAFKKDHPEYKTEDDKINEIVKMIRDNHIDPKKIMDKLNDKVEESLKQSDMKLTEAKQILKNNGYLVESTNKIEIDCSNWHWVKSMSSYNNNYYYDTLSNDEFYLEECDEDYGDYLYYICDKSGKKLKYLGYTNREGSVENCNSKLVLDTSMPT